MVIRDFDMELITDENGKFIFVTEVITGYLESIIIEGDVFPSGQLKISLRNISIIEMKRMKLGIFPVRIQPTFQDVDGLYSFNSVRIPLNDELKIEYSAKPGEKIRVTIRYDGA